MAHGTPLRQCPTQAMVRPERFELPTSWFVARRSIQLSYGRNGARILTHCRKPAIKSAIRTKPAIPTGLPAWGLVAFTGLAEREGFEPSMGF